MEQKRVKRKSKLWSLITSVPELSILIMLIVGGYLIMLVFSNVQSTPVLSATSIGLIIVGYFLISTAVAILAVICGIGGGMIFTPIMLGFTSLDSLVIRATGLVVVMFNSTSKTTLTDELHTSFFTSQAKTSTSKEECSKNINIGILHFEGTRCACLQLDARQHVPPLMIRKRPRRPLQ